MTTLREAYTVACEHWDGRPGGRCMDAFAKACCEALGWKRTVESLKVADGVSLLAVLRADRSPKTVATYYGTFRRMLRLTGLETVNWPSAPVPPRRSREAMKGDDLDALIEWLDQHGFSETGDLARVLKGTGARIDVEALDPSHCTYIAGEQYDTLTMEGKGGHVRTIPIVDRPCRDVFQDSARMGALRDLTADAHRRRWRQGVAELGISTALATPHSVRHYYACEAYRKSGGNLVMVQALLGHSDPKTTARYLGVDLSAMAAALASTL